MSALPSSSRSRSRSASGTAAPGRGPSERASRFLSYLLRHHPQSVGLTLSPDGWAEIDSLLAALARDGRHPLTRAQLDALVAGDAKQRYSYDPPGRRIRANQGHSLPVDLGLPERTPPAVLYHGTHRAALRSILRQGLRPMGRHAVHLSADAGSAGQVGARRGEPVVLRVDAAAMHRDGHRFQRSENAVWLVAEVPARYLRQEPPDAGLGAGGEAASAGGEAAR